MNSPTIGGVCGEADSMVRMCKRPDHFMPVRKKRERERRTKGYNSPTLPVTASSARHNS